MFSIPYNNTQPVSAVGSICCHSSSQVNILHGFCMPFTKLWVSSTLLQYFCTLFIKLRMSLPKLLQVFRMLFTNLWVGPKLLYGFCMLFTKLWPTLNLLCSCAAFLIGIVTMCLCDLCVSNSHRIILLVARDLLIVESASIVLWEISHPAADDRWHVIFHVFLGILLKRRGIIVASISSSALVDGRTPDATFICL
jgi:hypothetical protein